MTHFAADYDALRNSVGAVWLKRDVVRISGPDAETYLQGQVSQDVTKLAVGDAAYAFVLQPHGKVDALVRLSRSGPEEFHVDVERGRSASLVERLERFKMRTKADVEALPSWKVLALMGPAAGAAAAGAAAVVSPVAWPNGQTGIDLLGEDPKVPGGVPLCDPDAYDALRIEAGIPYTGRELDERTIPAEAGINALAISFTKGCYTGQELVARIDARGGNLPRHLRGLILEGTEPPPGGTAIVPAGSRTPSTKPLGVLTSAAYSPRLGAVVALAYIRREVAPPATGVVDWDEGPVPCRIEKLPLP